MRYFQNLKLSFKLFIPCLLLILVAMGIVWGSMEGFNAMRVKVDEITQVTSQRQVAALLASGSINRASLNEKNVILSDSPVEAVPYQQNFHEQVAAAHKHIDHMVELADTAERKASNRALKMQMADYFSLMERTMALAMEGRIQEATELSQTEGRAKRLALVEAFENRVERNTKEMEEAARQIEASSESTVQRLLSMSGISMVVALVLLSVILRFGVVRPLSNIIHAMQRVSQGELETEISGTERKDEVGRLAKALGVFKQNAYEARRLTAEQEAAKKRAAQEQRAALNAMADKFEQNVGGIVTMVASSATEMQNSSRSLSSTANVTSEKVAVVAASTVQTSMNVQTVAASAEELTAAISEIGQQVNHAMNMSSRAVQAVDQTNVAMLDLNNAAQNIGQVVEIIRNISTQINLLSLNATIEAARAGEAGKGFAVVAGEVKALASQTGKAVDHIQEMVGQIQVSTERASSTIGEINEAIVSINEVSSAIASAVVEQQAATQEIANNIQQAAVGVEEVSSNIQGVNDASTEVGNSSGMMLDAASELSQQAESLSKQVSTFLETVRQAA
jgi:methyl-accepting chemotaxis protein